MKKTTTKTKSKKYNLDDKKGHKKLIDKKNEYKIYIKNLVMGWLVKDFNRNDKYFGLFDDDLEKASDASHIEKDVWH